MRKPCSTPRSAQAFGILTAALVGGLALAAGGCGALNSSFLALFDFGEGISLSTIPNSPGFVVVTFVNNAEVDERLVSFLAPQLELTGAETRALQPRVRMRVRITFRDGTFQTVEMISGSRSFVEPGADAASLPDLNQNDLTTVVAQCDVASVEVEPGSSIEVFVPVTLTAFELVETDTEGGGVTTEFQPRETRVPQFVALATDTVDDDGNVLLRSNIGVRDIPVPTTNVICGSIVAITMAGVLTVPFLDVVGANEPSFDRDDAETVALIGGRYEFRVSVH